MKEEGWRGGVGEEGEWGRSGGGRGGGGKKGARRRGEDGLYTYGNQKFISAVEFPARNSCLIHA